jgi:V8-like Glu-specific endopeptidase
MYLKSWTLVIGSLICTHAAMASNKPPVMLKSNTDPQAIINYWTPERMQEATPMDLPIVNQNPAMQVPVDEIMQKYKGQTPQIRYGAPPTIHVTPDTRQVIKQAVFENQNGIQPNDAGTLKEQFSSQQLVPLSADLTYPYRTVGKLYVTTPSGNKTCSAVVIANRVVATAAHCMHSGKGWYSNWMFVPAYRDGTMPFKQWTFKSGAIQSQWIDSGGAIPNAYDYACIAFNDQTINGTTAKLADVVGKIGVQTLSTIPNHAHILGYPGNLDKGEKMHQVTAQSAVAVSPNNAEYGSDMSTGAGGGPWIQNFGPASTGQTGGTNPARNMLIGITSYGFNDTYSFGNGSVILDNDFLDLFNFVCNQAAGNC